jgi:hypothetical protein
MANQPANAGSSGGQPPRGNALPPFGPAPHPLAAPVPGPTAAPQALPQTRPRAQPPTPSQAPSRTSATAGHRAVRPRETESKWLAWLPYLIVLAGTAAGLYEVFQGSGYTSHGTELVGGSLLAAGLARLVLPARFAGLLSTRRKASDVLAFAVLGAGVLAVALTLP